MHYWPPRSLPSYCALRDDELLTPYLVMCRPGTLGSRQYGGVELIALLALSFFEPPRSSNLAQPRGSLFVGAIWIFDAVKVSFSDRKERVLAMPDVIHTSQYDLPSSP
jgi:hypothetical protein